MVKEEEPMTPAQMAINGLKVRKFAYTNHSFLYLLSHIQVY